MVNKKGANKKRVKVSVKTTEVTKGDKCLDCGKKISQEKFAEQEGLCDKCYGPFLDDVSQEEYPTEMFGE